MLTSKQIETFIEQGLSCEHVAVMGDDGQHFEALVVSSEFAGKNMVQQHQMVYKALGDKMRSEIHALSMRTFTPEQWKAQGQQQGNK